MSSKNNKKILFLPLALAINKNILYTYIMKNNIKKDSVEATKIVKMTEAAVSKVETMDILRVTHFPNEHIRLQVPLILSDLEREFKFSFSDLDRERCEKILDKAHQMHRAKGKNGLVRFVDAARRRFYDYSGKGVRGIFNQP